MANVEELRPDELTVVSGGATPYTRVDPKTGETVIYSDTGVELGRLPEGGLTGLSN